MKQIISQYNLKLTPDFTSKNGQKTKEQVLQDLGNHFANAIDKNQIKKM